MQFIGQIHNRWVGFSTETKPTGDDVPTGSIFDELDQRRRWIYYAGTWYEDFTNDVFIQDQFSPALIVPMNKVENETTLLFPTAINDKTITVANATGFSLGKFISITNVAENRYYTGEVLNVAAGVVTVDSPLDFAFPVTGSVVVQGTHDLTVDGSITPQIFSLRASDPGLPVVIDITRLIFTMVTVGPVNLTRFGDIEGGITNGIVLRKKDGIYNNISNFKSNQDIAGAMFDYTPYLATNPAQGEDGFVARMTFAGQNKMGVAIRVGPDEDLELIIQDDLTSLISFQIIVEGHVVI